MMSSPESKRFSYWQPLASLAAPDAVILTISDAANDTNVVNMTTLLFKYSRPACTTRADIADVAYIRGHPK